MAPNKSVIAFRKLTVDMQRQIFNDAVAELDAQADGLVQTMRTVVAHGPTSNLANSIRKEAGQERNRAWWCGPAARPRRRRSPAANAMTTRVRSNIGTEKGVSAQPFFFPSYRLMRKKMRSAMWRKITKTIKQYSAE